MPKLGQNYEHCWVLLGNHVRSAVHVDFSHSSSSAAEFQNRSIEFSMKIIVIMICEQ